MHKNYKLVGAEVIRLDTFYQYLRGTLVDNKGNLVQITELSAEPLAFEIHRNGKVIASVWYPDAKINHFILPQKFIWVAQKMC